MVLRAASDAKGGQQTFSAIAKQTTWRFSGRSKQAHKDGLLLSWKMGP